MLSIYLTHPMTGLPLRDVFAYYDDLTAKLRDIGYRALSPMLGTDWLREEADQPAGAIGYDDHPLCTPKAIFRRDHWMVREANVVFADFTGATSPSIGSCFELAWAHEIGAYVVVVMDRGNPHWHSFVLAGADVVFPTADDALDYLATLFHETSPVLKV